MKVLGKLLALGSIGYVLATIPLHADAHSSKNMCRQLDKVVAPQADERFIKNKVELPSILLKFNALKVYSFQSRSYCGDLRSDAGLSAQEVEKVFPGAVYELKGQKVISQDRLLPLVVQAVAELSVKASENLDLSAIKAEMISLSSEMLVLKNEINAIRSQGLTDSQRIAELEAEQRSLSDRVKRLEAMLGI